MTADLQICDEPIQPLVQSSNFRVDDLCIHVDLSDLGLGLVLGHGSVRLDGRDQPHRTGHEHADEPRPLQELLLAHEPKIVDHGTRRILGGEADGEPVQPQVAVVVPTDRTDLLEQPPTASVFPVVPAEIVPRDRLDRVRQSVLDEAVPIDEPT